MLSTLQPSTCIQFLVSAHLCNLSDLVTASMHILTKSSMKNTEEWNDMKKEYPDLAIKVSEMFMD